MGASKLKLNPDKTEFILFGSKLQREKLASCFPVNILGNDLSPANTVRNLGVLFDSGFTFSDHVAAICRSCFVGLRDFRRIRRHLPKAVAITVANALVSSRLDYCNSLFRSLSSRDLRRLQCIQNSAARIVTNTSKFAHISPILNSLHWLPVKYRCIFKTCMLIYKYLDTGLPSYFTSYIARYSSSMVTRRSDPSNLFLEVPAFSSSFHKSKSHFQHSFSYDGPKLWNDLPHDIRTASSLFSFRRKLKAQLFRLAFPP